MKVARHNNQHKLFVESFAAILHFKFDQKLGELTDKITNMLADILYLLNKHSKQLLYFYPELIQDPMLRKHLEKMVPLNKDHISSLTKDIQMNEIANPIGNVVKLCQLVGLGK